MKGMIAHIGETATRVGSKALFKLKKASPELLLAGGVVLIIGGTVMACKATKKTEDILDEGQKEVEEIKERVLESVEFIESDADPDKLVKKDIVKSKLRTFGRIAGVYAPAVALGTAGIAMIFTSHGIMRKRQGMLLASYNALDAAFRSYRQRVLEDENGIERDRRYLVGDRQELIEFTENENGELVRSVNQQGMSLAASLAPYGPYTFEFSKFTTTRWQSHSDSNLLLIRGCENWATSQLRLNGHLFLNDVLDYLDMEKVPWGQLVGWLRGGKDGDSYVELITSDVAAMLEMDSDAWKKPFFIEANCDGVIWDKI